MAAYIEASFFQPSILLSFVQYVIGPYADDLGNVLPHAVEGVGVPVNPAAFAGLLGLVVTALDLLPAGSLDGGRIVQATLGRRRAQQVSFVTTALLGVAGVSGSFICLAWGFIIVFLRNSQELPALDEAAPLDARRTAVGAVLLAASLLLLFTNSAANFPSAFLTPQGGLL
eukprot:SM000095S24984  [mRNA]  locus=s95:221382:222706:- [translate_table: standard]